MDRRNLTLLCTGDLHLGRHPTRIPSELDGQQFSPTAVWRETVEEAIRRRVDAVLVTGDVVDRENRYFEAYGAFEEGVLRLETEDIPLVAVAGNHDFDVLPRLIREIDSENVTLLGDGGRWEQWTLTGDDEPRLHVHGWSFPRAHVVTSPLEEYDLSAESAAPVLGVVHADLGSAGSQYGPVHPDELLEKPVDGWLLGHIHKPTVHNERDPFVFYPGSPQPLDPGERGVHGPWELQITPGGALTAAQVPLATVRYGRFEVDVSGAGDPKAVPSLVRAAVEERVRSGGELEALELVLARVRLTGRTTAHSALHRHRATIEDDHGFTVGTVPVRLDSIEVATRPAIDLEQRAGGDGPDAYLADLLLAIENGTVTDDYGPLVQEALRSVRTAQDSGAYRELRRQGRLDSSDETDAVSVLESQARLLLDTLIEQKEAST
ncbi:metallophosphoesterase family protein [Natronobiforma cellulositropha]|uniref:metallophosphoesterase family protein n=1 Tax=Natronobiforma cellulositropha TaxID=1679076 RepID=UPI0021D5924C|nr:DNA repair exonuclease [Natronobiforma cellulositropha]